MLPSKDGKTERFLHVLHPSANQKEPFKTGWVSWVGFLPTIDDANPKILTSGAGDVNCHTRIKESKVKSPSSPLF